MEKTERTTLKRLPMRAEYDRARVYEILDEAFITVLRETPSSVASSRVD